MVLELRDNSKKENNGDYQYYGAIRSFRVDIYKVM